MTSLVPANFGQLSTRFSGQAAVNDLGAGIQAGYGLIGYKGKVWSIRHKGQEIPLMRDDGDGPRNSIEVVILKASPAVSKIWYEVGYVEGSSAPPDCFSTNGVTPDPSSPKLQNSTCAACPRNAWGSRITPAGKKGKDCQDSKRLAVAPLADIRNEMFGGPMLLRVPAASLQEMSAFGSTMQGLGYPYFAVGTRISFDANESYPKFKFNAIRPLSDGEAEAVIELQRGDMVSRVLADNVEAALSQTQANQQTLTTAFEQPPAAVAAAVAPKVDGTAVTAGLNQQGVSTGQQAINPAHPSAPTAPPSESVVNGQTAVQPSGFGPIPANTFVKATDHDDPTIGGASTQSAQTASITGQGTQKDTVSGLAPMLNGSVDNSNGAAIAAENKVSQQSGEAEVTTQGNTESNTNTNGTGSNFEADLQARLDKLLGGGA